MATDRASLADFAAAAGLSTHPSTDLDLEMTDTYAIDCYIMDTIWSPAGDLVYAEYFSGGTRDPRGDRVGVFRPYGTRDVAALRAFPRPRGTSLRLPAVVDFDRGIR